MTPLRIRLGLTKTVERKESDSIKIGEVKIHKIGKGLLKPGKEVLIANLKDKIVIYDFETGESVIFLSDDEKNTSKIEVVAPRSEQGALGPAQERKGGAVVGSPAPDQEPNYRTGGTHR